MFPITISLNEASEKPLYRQLYEEIAEAINRGLLQSGEKLPSKRNLCRLLHVSHSTVENAYGLLKAEGYIESIPKSGYVVASLSLSPAAQESSSVSKDIKSKTQEPSPQVKTDLFPIGAIATEQFPYSSWARIYREVIYQTPELLEKGDPQGEYALRRELAAYLAEYRGTVCDPRQIVIGAGFEYLMERLLMVLRSLDRRDRPIALEDPGYPAAERIARAFQIPIEYIPVDKSGMKIEKLENSTAGIVFVTPSHQFPTGATMPLSRRTALLKWARENEAYVIEDDYDSDFRYQSRPIRSMQGIDDASHVIYLGTFNRTIAPAVRVAYMILPEPVLEAYQTMFAKQAVTVSRFEQVALSKLMASGIYARHIRRSSNLYKKRGEALKQALLKALPECSITGDGAGLHFLLHLPDVSEKKLIQCAENEQMILHPMSAYQHHGSSRGCTLVIGFAGLSETRMEVSVNCLQNLIHKAKLI